MYLCIRWMAHLWLPLPYEPSFLNHKAINLFGHPTHVGSGQLPHWPQETSTTWVIASITLPFLGSKELQSIALKPNSNKCLTSSYNHKKRILNK